MIDNTSFAFIDETNKTEEQVTKELKTSYLAGLVQERQYNEVRLAQLKEAPVPDEAEIKRISDDLEAVKSVLAEVGDEREPRNKVRK